MNKFWAPDNAVSQCIELNKRRTDQFLRAVVYSTTNECMLWPHSRSGQMGYGVITFNGKKQYVHRLSYMLTHGFIPAGLHVLHCCDTPLCFNPRHLFAGTEYDNRQDQKRKRRTLIGTRNPQARLTESQVIAIRSLYQKNVKGFGQDALAQRFGVTRIAIRKIVRRETWGLL